MRSLVRGACGWMVWVLAAGCIQRVPVTRLAEPQAISVLYVVDGAQEAAVSEAPAELRAAVEAALAQRNLQPQVQPLAPLVPTFSRVRESNRRMAELSRVSGEAPLRLLVELDAEFFSHLQGRYRWQARARLTATRSTGELATDALSFPVYVNFDHEQAPAVLATAAPTVADRAGELLDQVLSAGN
jgi:hypothetical protein